jgi:beta-N-acetylhexosaminidase
MTGDNEKDENFGWLYDRAQQPLSEANNNQNTDPLPVGDWQEHLPRRHRLAKVAVSLAGLTLISAIGVKGYEYLENEHQSNLPEPSSSGLPTSPSAEPTSTPSAERPTQAECITKLPLALKLGQKLMISATAATIAESSDFVAKNNVGGVILMKPVPSSAAVKMFVDNQALPPLVATDQEGGIVQRYTSEGPLPAASDVPGMDLAELGRRIRQDDIYLRNQGVNMNLAPVVDVAPAGGTSVRGSRIFSSDPAVVARDALVYVRAGLQTGVLPTLKHYPGLGSASHNTDFGTATTPDFAQMQRRDLIPYEKFAGTKAAVMVGNQIVPGLTDGLPASLSRAAITDELRGNLGYQNNIVITDSLSAAAITTRYSITEAAVRAWEAGVDIALFVSPQPGMSIREQAQQIIRAAKAAVRNGQLDVTDINASTGRIFALPQKHVDACDITNIHTEE